MMYVNKQMIHKNMPNNLRLKIRRFLDYNFEQKKEIKLEDKDIFLELNSSLKLRLKVYLVGRILSKISFLDKSKFGIEMITEMVDSMHKKSLVKDDYLFIEKDEADCVYYIEVGSVAMLHK